MVALIHDEGVLGDGFGINFIGIEEVDEFGFCCRSLLGGHEADFIRSGARGDLGEKIMSLRVRVVTANIPFAKQRNRSTLE